MDKELTEKCRLTDEEIRTQIDFNSPHVFLDICKAQLTKATPIIQNAERERIATIASFTVKLEGKTVVVDAVDWNRLWQALEATYLEERKDEGAFR